MTRWTPDPGSSRFGLWIGVLLGLIAFAWFFPGLDEVGVTWDEPVYFSSVVRIQEWVGGVIRGPDRAALLTEEAIRGAWDVDRFWNPHPPAYKEAMAATEGLFEQWTGSLVGYRIASLVCFSLLLVAVAWVAGSAWGRVAAIGAVLAVVLMPRMAGHAHIGATDMPLTLTWFVAATGLVSYVVSGRRIALLAGGIALGLALATKFTAYLLPLSLFLWMVPFGMSRRGIRGAVVWGLIGLTVAWAVNPLAWHDPIVETARLFAESLSREERVPIATYYMGHSWGYAVPGHHAVVMALITIPLPILALALGGATGAARRFTERPLGTLCLTQILFFVALMAAPGTPNHDGVRLFLPMFPFVGLLAGRGFQGLTEAASRRLPTDGRFVAGVALGFLFFLPPYVATVRVAPLYLSYYNEIIGGLRGAAAAGMETTYWLDAATPRFLAQVSAELPPGARLAAYPHTEHYRSLQLYGMIREDIQVTDEWPPDYFILVARKAMFLPHHWRIYENVRPELAVELQGVELAGLYAWTDDEAFEPDPEEP
jgi:4-amino-4-deoxy-L-arabinose transferase-like glycosyltransferase